MFCCPLDPEAIPTHHEGHDPATRPRSRRGEDTITPRRRRAPVARPKGTRARIRAVCGIWLLDGRLVKLHEDVRTGALLASYKNGERENPLRVLTRGARAELPEWSSPRAHSQGGEEA